MNISPALLVLGANPISMKIIFTLFLTAIITFTANSQGLDFDGTNDYVRLPGHPSVMNGAAFTFETSIKPRQNGSEILSIATRGNGDPFYLYIEPMGGGMPGEEEEPTSWMIMCDLWNTSYNLHRAAYVIDANFFNNWHHIAASFNGSQWILYIDGAAVSTVPVTGTIVNMSAQPLYLGMYQNMWHFAGTMDEIRIWNTARSQAEIFSNMKKQVAYNSAGLVAYYSCNQGTANGNNTGISSLTDASAAANNASMHNFSLNGGSSNFTAGNPEIITLPLRVTAFAAREENNTVVLSWKSQEQNSFAIERSANGGNFIVLGHVPGNTPGQYHFTDGRPASGTNVYRLAGISPSGRKEYSVSIAIKTGRISALRIYPNPAANVLQLQLRYSGAETGYIMDMTGKRVKTIELPATTSFTSSILTLDISDLPAGSYALEAGGQQVKFVKQ